MLWVAAKQTALYKGASKSADIPLVLVLCRTPRTNQEPSSSSWMTSLKIVVLVRLNLWYSIGVNTD